MNYSYTAVAVVYFLSAACGFFRQLYEYLAGSISSIRRTRSDIAKRFSRLFGRRILFKPRQDVIDLGDQLTGPAGNIVRRTGHFD